MKSTAKGSVRHHNFKSNGSKFYRLRSGKAARVLLALLVFSLILPASASMMSKGAPADGGDPVASFGASGFVATDFAGGNDAANAVAPTPDGKIIAAGLATMPTTGTDFALARYDGNGRLDPNFGIGGKVTTDFFGANDGARSMVVQPDGKIVLSGFTTNGSERQFALAGYLANGSLNPAFGQGGKLTFDLGSTSDAYKMVAQEDGKLLVVGESRPQNSLDFTILRLNPTDGSRDTSFGNNGVVTINFGNSDRATALAIDDKNLFVAGVAVKSATDSDFGIARLNLADGSLNNLFGGDGTVTIDFFGKQDGVQDLCLLQNLNLTDRPLILCGGSATNVTSDFGVAALDQNGNLVTSLFNQGKDSIDLKGGRDIIFDLDNQPDGDIVAAGWAGIGANFDLGIVKWDATGKRDLSWGLQGNVTFDTAAGGNNVAFDAMIYKDTIVTVGQGLNTITGNDDFILTQHENEKFVEFKKQGPSSPVVQGEIISYTFEITNLTDKEITFQVQDSLPILDVTFITDQNTGWVVASQGRVERNLVVPSGQTSLFALRVRANRAGTIENNATLLQFASYILYKGVEYSVVSSDSVETEVSEFAITEATRNGKNLNVKTNGLPADTSGTNQSDAIVENAIEPQAACPVVLFDGVEQNTKRDPDNPSTVLIVKKGFKRIAPGQTVMIKVRLCDGTETAGFPYTRPQ
jgi:uncharacterized delta-60 repeat protein